VNGLKRMPAASCKEFGSNSLCSCVSVSSTFEIGQLNLHSSGKDSGQILGRFQSFEMVGIGAEISTLYVLAAC
jgi:hypothetical protein